MDPECCTAFFGWSEAPHPGGGPPTPCDCLGDPKGTGVDDGCKAQVKGACCQWTGDCQVMTQAECALITGSGYKGDYTNCHGDTNGNGIDDACEHYQIPAFSTYGIVILALLLVAAAVIVMRQRRMQRA